MATTEGSAKQRATTKEDTTTDKPGDPALQPVEERMADGQKLAKAAQLKVAERSPEKYPSDIGQVAGDEGAGQLSDWEKQTSAAHPDVTAESVNKDLFERAALPPVEKRASDKFPEIK